MQLWLTAVVLAALALSLALSYAVATAPRRALRTPPHEAPTIASIAAPPTQTLTAPVTAGGNDYSLLWALLTPWALVTDAVAVFGVAVVIVVGRSARRRRGAQR